MILVTGGTGLVGSHLLYKLTKEGNAVVAIYRSKHTIAKVKAVFAFYADGVNEQFSLIKWKRATLDNIPELQEAFIGITHVYHAAALISFDAKAYKKLWKTNVKGTANIVNLCVANSVKKLCYVSSIAALGKPLDSDEVITEKTTWNPDVKKDVYAITKYAAELEVWRGSQEGLDVVIVNPGVVIGPGFWNSGSGELFKKINKGLVYYPTGGTGFVAITDVITAMVQLMGSTVAMERFTLVNKNLKYQEVIMLISDIFNKKPPEKPLQQWMLAILWRLDWLRCFVTRSSRKLDRFGASSASSQSFYSSDKLIKSLDFEFSNLDKAMHFCANKFIEQQT